MLIRFLIYGLMGWCMEVLWTGLGSFMKRDYRLTSTTSIWMFFIYGMAVFLEPVCNLLFSLPVMLRGGVYVLCIFMIEYITGSFLKKINICPWDYGDSKYNVQGVIRLDYAPVWFTAGLLFEYMYMFLR